MSKKFISVLMLIAMLVSVFGTVPVAFAADEVVSKVIYNFENVDYGAKYSSSGHYYVKVDQDGTEIPYDAITFRSRANVKMTDIDGESVLGYYYVSGKDTYNTIYATSDGNTHASISSGRYVFTSRFYATTDSLNGTLKLNGKANGESYSVSKKICDAINNKIKAHTWYIFKFTLDLDNHTARFSLIEEEPSSSGQAHALVVTTAYNGDTFSSLRCDFDISEGTSYNSTTGEGDFCAFDDFKLTYNTHSSKINSYSNGNLMEDNTFDNGIYTAETAGSGVFAIALYKDNEMVALQAVENEEELESVKLNMVVENGEGYYIRTFRFDNDGTPICLSKTITPKAKDYRVFFNETFDNGSNYLSTTNVTSDGRIKISGLGTRYGGATVYYPDRYYVVEADYTLPDGAECVDGVRLLCSYTNSPVAVIYMGVGGIYAGRSGHGALIMDDEVLEEQKTVNIACIFDLEEFTYDVYVDRQLKLENVSLSTLMNSDTKYGGNTFYAAYLKDADYTIYLDNYKAYSGNKLMDIGNDITTAHRNDFKNSPIWESDIFERPESYEIAKSALETGHPRLLVNSDRVKEIKNSTDARMVKWRNELMARADALLSTQPFIYAMSSTNSIQNIPESMALMMDLGMAYLLTGDTRYSDRAYKEAEVLYTVPYVKYNGDEIPEETRDYWNSYSYLDVGEISYILGLCYDWMYDAWTPGQIKELTQNVMEKGIMRHYKVYFGEKLTNINTAAGSPGFFKGGGNWNGVCNGGALLSAIAFMEQDVYTCASVAEAAVVSFEHMLKTFYPDGAWFEGAGYWNYNLKYFTAACATLDAACGSDFGLNKAPGLKGSQLYSISLEGKTGVTNFGDGGSDRVNAPFLFYWANKYKDTDIGGAALYMKDEFGYNASCYDLVYYKPDYVVENWLPPLSFYYGGTEVVSFTAGREDTDTYIAISGGPGRENNHDHLDSGAIVLEMKGHRLFNDLGAEHYGAAGYFSTNRYLYFRARPEGHSTFVIDPMCTSDADGNVYYGQVVSAVSKITSYDPANKKATMDLSDAYARDASKASRTISLDGNTAIIEDAITLKDTKDIYWNWYIRTYDSDARKTIATINISDDGKTATAIRGDVTYDISFETDCDYTLEVQAADYYVNVDPDVGGKKHKNTDFKRLVLKLTGASGTVNVKTIVK